MEELNCQMSSTQLLAAVESMSPDELDRFAGEVLTLRARQRAAALPFDESALFERINDALPAGERARLMTLRGLRDDESLSEVEYRELLDLEERVELLNAKRVEALVELAALRGSTLEAVMDQLGIRPHGRG